MKVPREFQVFVKPIGSICNLECRYCYYLNKNKLYPKIESFRMPDDQLEEYIVQHIEACSEPEIRFSWHGGEPTLLGLDYFRNITALQRKHQPPGRHITNGIQTNGILLNEDWCRFLAAEDFSVGISLDGPREMHDRYRVTKGGKPTHEKTMAGYQLLQKHEIANDVLCVVNANNVGYPTEVYRFFKKIKAQYISFLPLVEQQTDKTSGVSSLSVAAETWGDFLCTIFDQWRQEDIGRIKVQIFEEAARIAFGQEHSLCIFREICGDIPVIEHNGDFYSCDHFVDAEHMLGNIQETPLAELLENRAQRAFGQAKAATLPRYCRECEVLNMCNGECPKNRFIRTPDGEAGLNFLCSGYKQFFTYCQPFITQVASIWDQQNTTTVEEPAIRSKVKTGRNDPCSCGSGKKYKKCCMGG